MEAEAPLWVFARYLQAAVAHPEAHGVHVDVVGLEAFAPLGPSGKVSINGAGVFLSLKTAIKTEREREEREQE